MSDVTALTVPPPGWYPDRNEANTSRWWDGQQWTEHTQKAAPAGAAFEQPVSAAVFGFGSSGTEPVAPVPVAPALVVPAQVVPALVEPAAPREPEAPIAGWYLDDRDPSLLRWWDGDRWTAHVCAADVTARDL